MAKLWLILGICLAIFGTFGEQVQALRNVRDIEHQSALGDLGFDQQRKDEEDHDYEEVMDDYELQDSFSNTSLVYFNASDYVNGSMPANVTRHHGFLHGFVESLSVILVSEIGDKTFFIAAIMAMTSNKLIVFLGAISALALMTVLSAVLGWVVTSFIPRKYTYYTCTVIMFLFGLKMLYEAWTMKPDEAQELQHEVEEELARRGSIASNSSRAREQTPEDEDQDPEGQELQEVRSEPGFDDDTEGDDASTAQSPKPKKRVQIQEKGLFGKKCYKIFKLFLNCFTMTFLAEWGDRSQLATIVLASINDVSGVCLGGVLGHTFCTGLAVIAGALIAKKISVRVVTLIGALVFLGFAIASLFFDPEEEEMIKIDF
ncbi:hypothetical protein TCAL_00210 [Tigriopus californicus]|uniref:GDT1 family protein n=1 Tax=Tigriopus californicus TaxID=6832 RepID=A0A553P3J0_TIGCA|nr:transmembrane protein 165-like [Tigriopus californicus]TRY72253.1 hypothetical protein TCAL_00210 [Tigriopus californicus]|eukprot:TCALIF_00210-PA protein Name:"Similar to TMEM165 Transmembrane protein 165 (Homo sapiens)" AED:0.05 eAED:0.05 QI:463/1/1/1/1/1/3/441/372